MALSQFFKNVPWLLSPIEVPCSLCARKIRENPTSALCKDCSRLIQKRSTKNEPQPFPLFRVFREATNIQLFYDLFFVANLSACTATHKIENLNDLGSCIGFVTLIWFTWFGTILFDVRFVVDSWFIRLSKACSLGVMALFAMTLVPFHFPMETFGHELRALSLILFVSRLFLVIQYSVILVLVLRRHPDGRSIWAFIATMLTSFIAAIIFLGTYWEDEPHWAGSLVIWWVTSVVEAAVLLLISCQSISMSFEQTKLVERMGALTLIVMGEGIIGMTESISSILRTSSTVSGSTIGLAIGVILTCYSTWMLYFDHTDTVDEPGERISKTSPRHEIWAFLHFPLHVAILMTLKGNTALMLWWVANEALTFAPLHNLGLDQLFSNMTGAEAFPIFEAAIYESIDRYNGVTNISQVTIRHYLDDIRNLGSFSNNSVSWEAIGLIGDIQNLFYYAVCDSLEIALPEEKTDTNSTTTNALSSSVGRSQILDVFDVFTIWFRVLFVGAGITLIMLAVLRYIGHEEGPIWPSWLHLNRTRHRTKPSVRPSRSLIGLGVQVLIGIVLAMFSFMSFPQEDGTFANFIPSPMMIPTVLLTYVLVITIDNILYKRYSKVHHPPIDFKENYCSIPSQNLSPAEFTPPERRPMHKSTSSANALLLPQLSLNDHGRDSTSLAWTETSRMYPDEDNDTFDEAYRP